MKGKEERFEKLFDLYVRRAATVSEEAELMRMLMDPELDAKKEALLGQVYDLSPSMVMNEEQAAQVFTNIIKNGKLEQRPASVVKITWKRWVAAASMILTLGIGTYVIVQKPAIKNETVRASEIKANDIKAPATNRATITLSSGQQIFLDNAANGKLLEQGGVELLKLADGKIAYNGSSDELIYNTLVNPKGSKVIDMVLADGSHVWLNAGSSLTFPLAFVGNERRVSITGEAYFEVAKNVEMPFRVTVDGKCEVEVLGTHFNINSYADESAIKTTLLEGRVKVTGLVNKESLLISPGEQAQLRANEKLALNIRPNLDQVMAWKNGYFHFDRADLQVVMRQLARWYDVEIVYEGEVPMRQFEGEMQVDLNLSQMLRILESNNVRFRIDGKRLIVSK